MFKTVTIFKNIKDMVAFQKHYVENLFPGLNNVPGITHTDVISLFQSSPVVSEELKGIQLLIETHFESEEIMNSYLVSQEAQDLMIIANQYSDCELYFFLGKGKRFHHTDPTDDHSQQIIRGIEYSGWLD
jgi:hypothetical protein